MKTNKEKNLSEIERKQKSRQKAWEENPGIYPGFSEYFVMTWFHKSDCNCSDCLLICKDY